MISYSDLLNLVKESDFTLIGFKLRHERIKDEFISHFSSIEIDEIGPSFSFKTFVRNSKIESVLETESYIKSPDFIIINLNNIIIEKESYTLGRQKVIKNIISGIKKDLSNTQYKVIFTCYINSSMNSNNGDIANFSSGSLPLYESNLVISISDNKIKVLKNRFGKDGDDIVYNLD